MDNSEHETTITITDSQLMRAIKPELDNLEARILVDTRNALVAALSTVPSNDEVLRMINERVNNARMELQASINSIDAHLRTAEGRVSEASKRMNTVADKIEAYIGELRDLFADVKSQVDSNTNRVNIIDNEISVARAQSNNNSIEVTQIKDHLDDLKSDVHGDPTKPEMPSLFRAIALTNDSVNKLNARVARYDTLVNVVAQVWQNKLGKAIIIFMLSAFATDIVYSATKVIQLVLSGGKTP